jgi:hypothetical protein
MPPVEGAESASLGRSIHVGALGGGVVVSALVVDGRSLVALLLDGMESISNYLWRVERRWSCCKVGL